jgi:hypothetical protein
VHCGECPRSCHVPRKFNSGNRNTRSRSNACSVSYVQEVEVGTVFTCEVFGKICTAEHAKSLSWSESKSFLNL